MSLHPILVKLPFFGLKNIPLVRINLLFQLESFWISIPLSNISTILSSRASFINPVSVTFSPHPSLYWTYWKRHQDTALSPNDLHPLQLVFSWQQFYSITVIPSDVLQCHGGSLKAATVGVFIPQTLANDTNRSSSPPSHPVKSHLLSTQQHGTALRPLVCVTLKTLGETLSNASKLTHISLWSLIAYKAVQYSWFNLVLSTSQEVKGLEVISIPILKMGNTRLMTDSGPDPQLASKGLKLPCSDLKASVLLRSPSDCSHAGCQKYPEFPQQPLLWGHNMDKLRGRTSKSLGPSH